MKAIVLILASLLSAAAVRADIDVLEPWVRAVPPGSKATAAFMKIVNTGNQPAVLIEARSEVAKDVRPMVTTKEVVDGREISGMEFVDSFEVEANGFRMLVPGGDHLMLMKLRSVPEKGDRVVLTLIFEVEKERKEVVVEASTR